jgi:hypothetical protein
VHQQETAVCEVHALRQCQVLAGLGDGDDLGASGAGRGCGHLVACAGIAVDGIDASFASHELREGNRDVAGTGTDVHASPSWREAQALEGGCQRSPVKVVAQPELVHRDDGTQSSLIGRYRAGLRLLRASDDDAL